MQGNVDVDITGHDATLESDMSEHVVEALRLNFGKCALQVGETMRAAGLHAIGTLLQTEAVLIKSNAPSQEHLAPLIEMTTKRIAGVVASSRYVLYQYNIRREHLPKAHSITPGRRSPTVSPLDDNGWVAVSSMVEKKTTAGVMDKLVEAGAGDVLIIKLDNCRV